MPSLIVRAPRGRESQVPVEEKPVTIGKKTTNTVVLTSPNVSREHCVIIPHAGRYFLRDLGSRNGTFLNGKRITTDVEISDGAAIQIVDYILTFANDATPVESRAVQRVEAPPPSQRRTPVSLKKKVHEYLIATLDLKHADLTSKSQEEVRARATEAGLAGASTYAREIPAWLDPNDLVKEVVDEAIGLGPIEDLLEDETVDEIMINGWSKIYVERNGRLVLTPKQFTSNEQVLAVIRRILAPIGRRIDESSPMVNARLQDGSRVNAIISPLSLTGPTLTIRKFAKTPFTTDDLVDRFGSLSREMGRFLAQAVRHRCNMCVSGGTGSGKTTLLNVLSNFIPADERIITIEDAAELKLRQEHVVSLEAKPPNIEGRGAVPIRELVINALRMRPDRIVVGECRGGEALDMLQAMNTGHDGSLTTLHANSPRDALARLETMVLMAGMDLPSRAIREQIASAIDFIVHESRMPDGSRKIVAISEICGLEGDVFALSEVFLFQQKGFDDQGQVIGQFRPTGYVPRFVEGLRQRGIPFPTEMFRVDSADRQEKSA